MPNRTRWSTVSIVKVKVNAKLSMCFNWAPRHEGVLREYRYSSTHSLTSALDGGEWSASRHGRFTSRERAPGTLLIGGWVGSRTILDPVVKRKIPSPRRESNPRTPVFQPVAQRYTDSAITALSFDNFYHNFISCTWPRSPRSNIRPVASRLNHTTVLQAFDQDLKSPQLQWWGAAAWVCGSRVYLFTEIQTALPYVLKVVENSSDASYWNVWNQPALVYCRSARDTKKTAKYLKQSHHATPRVVVVAAHEYTWVNVPAWARGVWAPDEGIWHQLWSIWWIDKRRTHIGQAGAGGRGGQGDFNSHSM
jgi:hypothetical protein